MDMTAVHFPSAFEKTETKSMRPPEQTEGVVLLLPPRSVLWCIGAFFARRLANSAIKIEETLEVSFTSHQFNLPFDQTIKRCHLPREIKRDGVLRNEVHVHS